MTNPFSEEQIKAMREAVALSMRDNPYYYCQDRSGMRLVDERLTALHAALFPAAGAGGEVEALRTALRALRREHHYECDDCFYSCPKSSDGDCRNDGTRTECDCGVDHYNAIIDAALSAAAERAKEGRDA